MVELEPDEVRRPAEAGARLVALRQLDEARAACERLPDPGDGEAIHDLRVALRRLRSTLGAYRAYLDPDATGDALRRIGRLAARTGTTRDAQVTLDWLRGERAELRPARSRLLDPLVETLEARVAAQQARASVGLAADFRQLERELRDSLETYRARVWPAGGARPSSLAEVSSAALKLTAAELQDSLAHVLGPEDIAAEHHARIVAKRLRYLLEPVRTITPEGLALLGDLRRLQDLIGDRHDRDVLATTVVSALEQAAIANASALAASIRARDAHAERRLRARPLENLLLELLRRAREQADAMFAQLAASWLGEKGADFFARVAEFASVLRQVDAAHMEIERKFLLSGLPERVRGAESTELDQGYLPGGVVRERLRRAVGPRGARFTRTVKLGTGIVRAEFEEELPESEFARLWPLTAGARLHKRRYLVPDGALVWEIDEFLDRALVLAEIELPTADAEVTLPEWLAPSVVREVTDEPAFTNLRLACDASAST
jgi:CHAD domain-containing protein/CYTH domain-containing protein